MQFIQKGATLSVKNNCRYYLELEPGDEKKIVAANSGEEGEPETIVVLVEQSSNYIIHVTEMENIKFVCHKKYSSVRDFEGAAFVIIKCFSETATVEYTNEGDEFNLIIPPGHEIQVTRGEDANVALNQMKSSIHDVVSGEILPYHQPSKTQYYFKAVPLSFNAQLKYPGMVHLIVDGEMSESEEYMHKPKSKNFYAKTGHTYFLSLLSDSQIRVRHEESEPIINSYVVNVTTGKEYKIFVQPNEEYIILGTRDFDDHNESSIKRAEVVIKGVNRGEEFTIHMTETEEFTLFVTPMLTIYVVIINMERVSRVIKSIECVSGCEYRLIVTGFFKLVAKDKNNFICNPAVVNCFCKDEKFVFIDDWMSPTGLSEGRLLPAEETY